MKAGLESLGRIRARGLALLLVTFIVGALAGVAIERARLARRIARAVPAAGVYRRQPDIAMPHMLRTLGLTPTQRAQVEEIIRRGQPRTDAVLDEMLPRLHGVTDSIHAEIRAVLTPEQAAQLDSQMERMRRRHGPMRMRPGRSGPPPP